MAADKIDISKSEFILSQPPDLHAADVVVNARDAGLAIDLPLVYTVRTRASARRQAPTPSAETSPGTTKSAAVASGPTAARASKAESNRPRTNLRPKEIAEPAKSAGSKLEAGSVDSVRRSNKATRRPAAKKGLSRILVKRTPLPSVSRRSADAAIRAGEQRPSVSRRNDEELLMIIAAEVGLGRAISILQAERARVRAIFGR